MPDIDILSFLIVSAAEGGQDPFNWYFVLKHAINLFILIGIIVYFARIPIKKGLERRRANISREIDEAKEEIEIATQKFNEYNEKINRIESEVADLKESIRSLSESERDEIIKQATQTCELIKKESRDTIELEALRAKEEVQREVANSSLELAEKLIREKMGETYNSKSVDGLISQIEEGKWLQ